MKKGKIKDIIINIFLGIGIILCIFLVVFKLTFTKVIVNGSSMNPSVEDGTTGYMIKVGKFSKIERFDVVSSQHGEDKTFYIIKRVLGLPNETVELKDNVLKINGQEVVQDFEFIKTNYNFKETQWTLAENEYLLVGDNRKVTIDPEIKTKDQIFAKNGFVIGKYDVDSDKCNNGDYESCPIEYRKWYWFKNGK